MLSYSYPGAAPSTVPGVMASGSWAFSSAITATAAGLTTGAAPSNPMGFTPETFFNSKAVV